MSDFKSRICEAKSLPSEQLADTVLLFAVEPRSSPSTAAVVAEEPLSLDESQNIVASGIVARQVVALVSMHPCVVEVSFQG